MKSTFDCGEYVIYGTSGVCLISDITTLNLDHVPKDRLYYVLRPVNVSGGVIYIPVDNSEAKMQRILTKSEVMELIGRIPQIHPLVAPNEKALEETYKTCMKSFDRIEWIRLIKCIYSRIQRRSEQGKKTTAVDERYMQLAKEALYSELALVLNIPKNEVEEFIRSNLDDSKEGMKGENERKEREEISCQETSFKE